MSCRSGLFWPLSWKFVIFNREEVWKILCLGGHYKSMQLINFSVYCTLSGKEVHQRVWWWCSSLLRSFPLGSITRMDWILGCLGESGQLDIRASYPGRIKIGGWGRKSLLPNENRKRIICPVYWLHKRSCLFVPNLCKKKPSGFCKTALQQMSIWDRERGSFSCMGWLHLPEGGIAQWWVKEGKGPHPGVSVGLPKAVQSAGSKGTLVQMELGGIWPLGDHQEEKMLLSGGTSEGLGLTVWV